MNREELHDTGSTSHLYRDIIVSPFSYLLEAAGQFPSFFDHEERRLLLTSLAIGLVVWGVVYSLELGVHFLFEMTMQWVEVAGAEVFVFVPLLLGAMAVAWLSRRRSTKIDYRDNEGHVHELNDVEGDGLERTIALYYTSEPQLEQALLGREGVEARWQLPTFSLAGRKWLATLITLGFGGSGGLEASVALIGESLAAGMFKPRQRYGRVTLRFHNHLWRSFWTRWWRWWRSTTTDSLQTAQLAGVAAAITTLLGTPLAGAFFATEVMYRRRPVIEKLVFALVASLSAFFMGHIVSGGHEVLFHPGVLPQPTFALRYYLAIAVMALLVAFVSLYFTRMRYSLGDGLQHTIDNLWLRFALGAVATGGIAILASGLSGQQLDLVLGPGTGAILRALSDEYTVRIAFIALIAKLFATLFTIGSGGSAGLLVPAVYLGAMVGVIVARWFGLPAAVIVVPAMSAGLVGIVNVPLTAMLFTVESFGAAYLLPGLVTLIITLIFAHGNSVYRSQREYEDKREIVPGYSVRRINVPHVWAGHSLSTLGLRNRYDINVIGMIDRTDSDKKEMGERIRPQVPISMGLRRGDLLIVLGENERLDEMMADIREEEMHHTEQLQAKAKARAARHEAAD